MENLNRLLAFIRKTNNIIDLQLGTLTIGKQLGQGGNGIVFQGTLEGHLVAIKFLVTNSTGDSAKRKVKRFLAEYLNVVTIKENDLIVRYVDYDTVEIEDIHGTLEIPIILMKCYKSSLKQLSENKTLSFKYLLDFLLSVAEKLHHNGIIHRDIKPENILVDGDDSLVLADFGIASYNPEIFKLRSETKKTERIGNRLFSAPEQEESGIAAHATMDIFAIGQILQWFVTGKTHRGTGREHIKVSGDKDSVYNSVIEKCLHNNPSLRFQTIGEIRTFIEERTQKVKGPFQLLPLFSDVCRSSFPRTEKGVAASTEAKKIDLLLGNLSKQVGEFERDLWWHDGSGNLNIEKITNVSPGVWNIDGTEYDISEVWVHLSVRHYTDFILIHFKAGQPFMFEGKPRFNEVIVDGKYSITHAERSNGYAEIDGEVVDLSDHDVVDIERPQEAGYVFIGTRYHSILHIKNDRQVVQFLKSFDQRQGESDKRESLIKFAWEIGENKHLEVEMNL